MNASCHELPCETPPFFAFLAFHGHRLRCGKASLQLVLMLRQGVWRSCRKAKPVSISINSAFVRSIPMTSLYRRITPSLLRTRPFSPKFSLDIFAMECHLIMSRHGGFQSFCLAKILRTLNRPKRYYESAGFQTMMARQGKDPTYECTKS